MVNLEFLEIAVCLATLYGIVTKPIQNSLKSLTKSVDKLFAKQSDMKDEIRDVHTKVNRAHERIDETRSEIGLQNRK